MCSSVGTTYTARSNNSKKLNLKSRGVSASSTAQKYAPTAVSGRPKTASYVRPAGTGTGMIGKYSYGQKKQA